MAAHTHMTSLRPTPDVVARHLGSVAVLIHLGTNRIFELNPTGSRVWALVEQGLGRDAICARIEAEFDAPSADAAQAVDDLLSQLTSERLICA